jgi:hypothetical protein
MYSIKKSLPRLTDLFDVLSEEEDEEVEDNEVVVASNELLRICETSWIKTETQALSRQASSSTLDNRSLNNL